MVRPSQHPIHSGRWRLVITAAVICAVLVIIALHSRLAGVIYLSYALPFAIPLFILSLSFMMVPHGCGHRIVDWGFALGAVAVPLILLSQDTLITPWYSDRIAEGWNNAFIGSSIPEETSKFLILTLMFWRLPASGRPGDMLLAAIGVATGFALAENIVYFLREEASWTDIGTARAIMSTAGHTLFGVTMGYFFGRAVAYPSRKSANLVLALVMPIVIHAMYNIMALANSGRGLVSVFMLGSVVVACAVIHVREISAAPSPVDSTGPRIALGGD